MSNEIILKKGFYDHHQGYSFVYLRQFMFTERDGKKQLHLRFMNESAVKITAIEMVLTQISSKGKVISRDVLLLDGLNAAPGEMYAPPKALAVSDGCVDFTIKITSVFSKEYKYTFRKGRATEHFDPRGYRKKKTTRKREGFVEKQPRFAGYGKFYWLITTVAILLTATACGLSVMYSTGELNNLFDAIKSFIF